MTDCAAGGSDAPVQRATPNRRVADVTIAHRWAGRRSSSSIAPAIGAVVAGGLDLELLQPLDRAFERVAAQVPRQGRAGRHADELRGEQVEVEVELGGERTPRHVDLGVRVDQHAVAVEQHALDPEQHGAVVHAGTEAGSTTAAPAAGAQIQIVARCPSWS